jgi:hypothetical protein
VGILSRKDIDAPLPALSRSGNEPSARNAITSEKRRDKSVFEVFVQDVIVAKPP